MRDEHCTPAACTHSLRGLLLEYLRTVNAGSWPGGDGQTAQDVLLSYPLYARVGLVPDRNELSRQYPTLVQELVAFFAERD
jgi:hypothetical protein